MAEFGVEQWIIGSEIHTPNYHVRREYSGAEPERHESGAVLLSPTLSHLIAGEPEIEDIHLLGLQATLHVSFDADPGEGTERVGLVLPNIPHDRASLLVASALEHSLFETACDEEGRVRREALPPVRPFSKFQPVELSNGSYAFSAGLVVARGVLGSLAQTDILIEAQSRFNARP